MILAAAILLILTAIIGLVSMFLDENLVVYGIVAKIILNVISIVLLWMGGVIVYAIIVIIAAVVGLVANFLGMVDNSGASIAAGIMAIISLICKVVIIVLLFMA